LKTIKVRAATVIGKTRKRIDDYIKRRPHRSFRLTRKRDIPKRVVLPGHIAFTKEVFGTLWRYRTIFSLFVVLYILLATALVGIAQQDQYTSFVAALRSFGPDILGGNFGKISETTTLFGAAITGGFATPLDRAGQLNSLLLTLFSWLTVVWLLRQLLAGNKVKLRDGLYNSGAPFISTLCILSVALLQTIPAAIGVVVYATASSTGVLEGGVEAMAFGIGALLLVVLSLYWLTGTFFAAIIVTLPGTYPLQALRNAGDIAFGRRTALLGRYLWLALVLLAMWAVVLIPILLLDGTFNVSWLPAVPVTVQFLGAMSVLLTTSYTYLLYRKMIDGDT
jgi:AcrR family transcriptional regulator